MAFQEVGLPQEKQAEIKAAHRDALAKGLYNPSCYMASNEKEYWAEGAAHRSSRVETHSMALGNLTCTYFCCA